MTMRIVGTIVTLVFALACGREAVQAPVTTAVEIAIVRAVPHHAGVRYSAAIAPDTEVALAFRIGGYVDQIAVEEGDRVKRGAMLARVREADYLEKLNQAAGAQREAEAALAQVERDLDVARALFAEKSLTKIELDAAQTRSDAARARVEGVRAAAGEAELALRDARLVSPIDGVVLRRNIERGELALPGAPALIVAATRTVKVEVGVPDVMIGSVKTGDSVEVRTESLPRRTFRAHVARIAPAADPKSRAFAVELHIDNQDDALKPGMVASLELDRATETPSLVVPLAAVIRAPKSESYAVYVVTGDVVRAQVVELGDPIGNLVTVRRGLRGGERVVVSGPSLLTDGQQVRVIAEALE